MISFFSEFFLLIKDTFFDALHVAKKIFKVVIPIIIIIKILTELSLIQYISIPFEPLMYLFGLPAEYAIAFIAALLVSLSGGIVAVVALIPELGVPTVAEASTFALVTLIAHSLLMECKIVQQCGLSFWGQAIIRFIVACFAGIGLNVFYLLTGFHQEPAHILLTVQTDPSFQAWALGEISNLLRIASLIWLVLFMHALLKKIHITDYLEKALTPFLKIFGISSSAASTVIIGFLAGILYGSGLLIKEAQSDKLTRKDLFLSTTLMGIAHAIVEDTILMLLIGASLWVSLGARLIVLLIAGIAIRYLYYRVYERKNLKKEALIAK